MGAEARALRDLSPKPRDWTVARRAHEAAEACGTPAYVYDLDAIDANVARLERALEGVELRLRYFEFANRNPAILARVRQLGHGITIARPTGIERALQAGFVPGQIELSGFGLADRELRRAAEVGIAINVASVSELRRAVQVIPDAPLGVRVDLGATPLDKRGIPLDQVLPLLRELPVHVAGIHTYVGTNLGSTGAHLDTVRRLLALIDLLPPAARAQLRYLNAGGGFGYDYDRRRHFGWEAYGAAVRDLLDEAAQRVGRRLELKLEVGRSVVVDCGCLVTRVNHAFAKQGRLFLAVDSNLSHCGRPARYGFDCERPPYSEDGRHKLVVLCAATDAAATIEAAVVGNSHYSRDWFGYAAVPALRPEAFVGCALVVLDAGAYSEAMADRWADEPRPPVVVLEGGEVRLVTERERLVDLVGRARDVLEDASLPARSYT